MYKAPKIAFIGKPNNGKSSIISALTMDDRIKIAPEAGTTRQVNEYIYKDRDKNTIAIFYDTPGFEHPKKIYEYLQKHTIADAIKHFSDEKYKKDVEILKAVNNSDVLSFVVDSSNIPDIHTHGYEIGILNLSKRPSVVVLNPHAEEDKNAEWKDFLKKFNLVKIIEFNPLKSGFVQINRFFETLEKFHPDIKELKKWHKEDFENRLNRSFELIADKIYELVTYEHKAKLNTHTAKLKEEYFKKLNKIETSLKNELKKLWGYYETPVVDTSFKLEDKEFSKEIGFSRTKLIALGIALGILVSVIDGGVTLASFIAAALFGGVVGASIKEVTDKLSNTVTFRLDDKKGHFVMLTSILRSLEFFDTLLTHGHANRNKIKISDDVKNWKYKADTFTKEEQKELNSIFKAFIEQKEVIKNKEKLKNLLKKKFLQKLG